MLVRGKKNLNLLIFIAKFGQKTRFLAVFYNFKKNLKFLKIFVDKKRKAKDNKLTWEFLRDSLNKSTINDEISSI